MATRFRPSAHASFPHEDDSGLRPAGPALDLFQEVAELGFFGAEIFFVVGTGGDLDRHPFDHLQAVAFDADNLARIVGNQADAVQPDGVIDASKVDVVAEVMRLTEGRGADVIITATAANITQEQAIAMAARNGRISFFGGLPKTNPTITCDSNLVHYRQLHIHGANGSAPEHNKKALEYIASGLVPVKDLITVHLPLERALEAFDIVAKGQAIKVTVEP